VNEIREAPTRKKKARLFNRRQMLQTGLRFAAVAAALVTNIIVARTLALDQIAYYYLYVTLAYFGNAGLYVGLGVALQKLCASLASSRSLDKIFLVRYMAMSVGGGTAAVLLFSITYLMAHGSEPHPLRVAACCAALSGANYLSSTTKDLLALSQRLTHAALLGLVEQVLKMVFVWLVLSYLHVVAAVDVAAATAAAAILTGVGGMSALLRFSASAHESTASSVKLQNIAHTVAPIGLSGLMNWLQLQSYRPVLLFFGTEPQIIGIASLLTSLGMTGANPVLSIIAQTYIPRLYVGEAGAFRKCIRAIAITALVAAIVSMPAAVAFLLVSGRRSLLFYMLLVPLGVMVEAANSLIGAYMHRRNVQGESMWILAKAGSIGVLIAAISWLLPHTTNNLPYIIGVGLVASQLAILAFLVASGRHRKYTTL